ncbi:MAG: DUF4129 domain-containing protein [Chloroflexia bacterium]|nr:DUF4129 domain-containing protein [Chloroflexia bacterium]
MDQQKHRRALLLLAASTIGLFFLAAGLSEVELMPGVSFPLGGSEGAGDAQVLGQPIGLVGLDDHWMTAIMISMQLMAISAILGFVFSKWFRQQALKHIYVVVLYTVIVFVGVRSLLLLQISYRLKDIPPGWGGISPGGQFLPPSPEFVPDPPHWLSFVLSLLLLCLLVGVAWYLGRRFRRSTSTAELIAMEAQETLESLQSGQDLGDAVRRCYFDMIQVLRRQRGLGREQAVTPREFEHQLLQTGLPQQAVRRLTRLFESVRYGARTPGKEQEQEAIACLRAIIESVGGSS